MALLVPHRSSLLPIIAGLGIEEWVAPAARYRVYAAPSAAVLVLGTVVAVVAGSIAVFLFALVAAGIAAIAPAWAVLNARGDAAIEQLELKTELDLMADQRVLMVIRQFEWAVADVERLRQTVRTAQAAKLQAEKRTKDADLNARRLRWLLDQARAEVSAAAQAGSMPRAEPDAGTEIELHWGIHDDGLLRWLLLEGGSHDAAPTMARLVSPDGTIAAISDRARPLHLDDGPIGLGGVLPRGVALLTMRLADELVAGLLSGDLPAYRFEAQVDDEWRIVRLTDTGSRTSTASDKRGRIYRAA